MKIALGQFAVRPDWQDNAAICLDLIARADAGGARLLCCRKASWRATSPIPTWCAAPPSRWTALHDPHAGGHPRPRADAGHDRARARRSGQGLEHQVALRGGRIVAQYRKLHLYDAFSMQESVNVVPGDEVPPLLEVDGLRFGMMTCYDLRFPELARRLAVDGADALLVPAAWVKGPLKEHHWEVLATARALDNTCYVVAVGECGPRNIGASMVVDPLGVAIARAAEQDALLYAELDPRRLAQARQALPVLANRRFARPELA